MSNQGLIIKNMYVSVSYYIHLGVVKTALNVIIVKEDLLSIENGYSKKILVWSAGEGWGMGTLNKIRVDFDNLEHKLSCCASTWFLQSYNDNLICAQASKRVDHRNSQCKQVENWFH